MTRRARATILWLIAVATLAACTSCSGPVVTAVGDSNDLVIIHDAGAGDIAGLAVATMEGEQSWLLGEPLFSTTVTTADRAGDLKSLRHVLLVGSREGGGVADMARKVFPGLERAGAPELMIAEDVWAKRQVVAALIGDDLPSVESFLRERGEEVRAAIEEAAVERLADSLVEAAAEAGMKSAMEERFGWSVSPPTGYDLFTTNFADGFVFFRRTGPDRTVFLYWTQGGPEYVSEQYAIAARDEVAGAYFDGDAIEWNRPVEAEYVEFAGRKAVRVSAWWGNRELVGGGPFRTYCFYDEGSGRVYLLDVSLFAPSYDKTALMRNLDAIAHTFEVK